MPFDNVHWTWMNGQFVPWDQSQVHLSAHALHYGTGVYEGIRSYVTVDNTVAIFRMPEHIDRLFKSAEAYGMVIPYTRQQLVDAVVEVITRNKFTASYIRPLVYLGSDTLGIRAQCPVQVAIMAWPNIMHVSAESRARGAKLGISKYRKFDSSMMPTTAKACGQYINSRLATMDALGRGFDEALLLDIHGNVAEAAVANLFMVRDGVIRTNDEKSSILLGITRDAAMQIAQSLGYKVTIDTITVDALRQADEIFLTGTACEILPITELDGKAVGTGRIGAVAATIRDTYDRAKTGTAKEWEQWLHRLPASAGKAVA